MTEEESSEVGVDELTTILGGSVSTATAILDRAVGLPGDHSVACPLVSRACAAARRSMSAA